MQLTYLHVHSFKSIRSMEIRDIEWTLILVGENNTGETSVLDAICAVCGYYRIQDRDFNESRQAIRIDARFSIEEEDLHLFRHMGIVSQYRHHDMWRRVFSERLLSFQSGELSFTFRVNQDSRVRYGDLYRKNGPCIHMVIPCIYRINAKRELSQLQNDLLVFQEDGEFRRLRSDNYIFERAKKCSHCFQCIGLVNKRKPEELSAFETARLLEFKIYQVNLNGFSGKVSENFFKNGGYEEIQYTLSCDADQLFSVEVAAHNHQRGTVRPVELMGKGMWSVYMLSLLETYISEQGRIPSITVMEDPEIFLHPQLQKTCSGILYRLSRKNQAIFKAHSPDLLFNFSTHRIRQVVLDDERYSVIRPRTNTSEILDDLECEANDLLNVSFVFIVEGKQDKSRLPLLLEKYYSETYGEEGDLYRISVITASNYTNIKAYANLKYMNQVYLRDQFPMIRDGDGKDPEELASQLRRYYDERDLEDVDRLPKVTRKNVFILKYYSFENYFLNPAVVTRLGVVGSEDVFYRALYDKWREYLYRIRNGQQLMEVLGQDFSSPEDAEEHIEEVHTFLRGHNLYDIFYDPFRNREKGILRTYTDLAPREDFRSILNTIDRFVYFNSRKRPENEGQAEKSMIQKGHNRKRI